MFILHNDNLSITINGKLLNIIEGKDYTLIQKCEELGIFLPRFCYHPELSIAGNCRMCLVESISSPKPVIACATPAISGMIIKTDNSFIRKIRQGMLEFLLLNHPLDCPICDQGGECDLQDLSVVFGSDIGRFNEEKRSVSDKHFGIMIKTVMTRCIHCTRCVRYVSELLGQPIIGTLGRGVNTEIGNYNNNYLLGYFTGNVIDLCPVGALTASPYSFKYRSWELSSFESIDILDSTCSSIRLDVRGNEVIRILPCFNSLVNDCWITDKIRFSYDSISNQRIVEPMVITKNRKWRDECMSYGWEYVFIEIKKYFFIKYNLIKKYNSFYFFTGKLLDIISLGSIFWFTNKLGINNINIFNFSYCSDYRNSYIMFTKLHEVKKSSFFLSVGVSLEKEIPILSIKLQKIQSLKKKLFLYYIGGKYNLDVNKGLKWNHIGLSDHVYLLIFYGKHFFSKTLKNNLISYLSIISSLSRYGRKDIDLVYWYKLSFLTSLKIIYNYLSLFVGEIHNNELNLFPRKRLDSSFYKIEKPSLLYLIGFDELELKTYSNLKKKETLIIYQGNIGDNSASKADVLLPTSNFFEKSSYYLSCENRLVRSNSSIDLLGNSWYDELVMYTLFLYLINDEKKKKHNYYSWYDYLLERLPYLNNLNNIISTNLFMEKLIKENNLFLLTNSVKKIVYSNRIYNFYKSDLFSKNSLNLSKCSILENKYITHNFLIKKKITL